MSIVFEKNFAFGAWRERGNDQKPDIVCFEIKNSFLAENTLDKSRLNLKSSHAELSRQLTAVNEELQPMKDIRRWVGKVLLPEQSEVESKPKPKHSITEKMRYYQEKEKGKTQGKAKAMEKEVL